MEFWIVEQGERRGPFQSYEVRDRIERGDLHGDELAWHKDRDDWVALREMDVFRSEFEEPEPPPVKPPPVPEGPPQPLLRFWARWFDVFLYITLVFAILRVTGRNLVEAAQTPMFSALWFIPFLILEGLALHLYKTTPGKRLLGLRVVTAEDKAISVGAALLRALRVYILGMGVLFLPLLLICQALCCWYTFKRGEAPWDTLAGLKVRSNGIDLYPALVFIVLFMTLLIVLSVLVLPGLVEHEKALRGASSST